MVWEGREGLTWLMSITYWYDPSVEEGTYTLDEFADNTDFGDRDSDAIPYTIVTGSFEIAGGESAQGGGGAGGEALVLEPFGGIIEPIGGTLLDGGGGAAAQSGGDGSLDSNFVEHDARGDGFVNVLDLIAIRNVYYTGYDLDDCPLGEACPDRDLFGCDVNGNSWINILDMLTIRNNLNDTDPILISKIEFRLFDSETGATIEDFDPIDLAGFDMWDNYETPLNELQYRFLLNDGVDLEIKTTLLTPNIPRDFEIRWIKLIDDVANPGTPVRPDPGSRPSFELENAPTPAGDFTNNGDGTFTLKQIIDIDEGEKGEVDSLSMQTFLGGSTGPDALMIRGPTIWIGSFDVTEIIGPSGFETAVEVTFPEAVGSWSVFNPVNSGTQFKYRYPDPGSWTDLLQDTVVQLDSGTGRQAQIATDLDQEPLSDIIIVWDDGSRERYVRGTGAPVMDFVIRTINDPEIDIEVIFPGVAGDWSVYDSENAGTEFFYRYSGTDDWLELTEGTVLRIDAATGRRVQIDTNLDAGDLSHMVIAWDNGSEADYVDGTGVPVVQGKQRVIFDLQAAGMPDEPGSNGDYPVDIMLNGPAVHVDFHAILPTWFAGTVHLVTLGGNLSVSPSGIIDVHALREDGCDVTAISEPGVPGQDAVEVWTWNPGGPTPSDYLFFKVSLVDLDIDSDNTNGYDPPDRSGYEEAIEDTEGDPAYPGKIILVNDGDVDLDGIPDFADGFDLKEDPASTDDDTCPGAKFVPLTFQIADTIVLANATISITYSDSDPAQTDYDEETGIYTPASGAMRIWLKDAWEQRNKNAANDAVEEDRGDYVPSGTYDPDMLGLSPGSLEVTLYVEALTPSVTPADQPINVTVTDLNGSYDDTVRTNLIQMQFVIPDSYDDETGLPAAGAEPVPTQFIGVSDPRPTVTLDALSSYDVSIGAGTATVTISGVVKDPIADNIPRGYVADGLADIDSVQVYLDGETYGGTETVTATDDGDPTFWRQHPYKGELPSLGVQIPLEEGTHIIRVETSDNAAGNSGFDEVTITLEKRVIPGGETGGGETVDVCIAFDEDPTTQEVDAIRYYYGDRAPDDDPTFTETPALAGELDASAELDAPADVAVDSTGSIYVADTANNRIAKFDSAGDLLLSWTCDAPESEPFNGPQGICTCTNDNVYVADTGNNKIKKFNSSGTWQADFGEVDDLEAPTDVAVDSTGNIYVTEPGIDQVQKYDAVAEEWAAWPAGATFTAPSSLVIAPDGHLYVSESGGVRKFVLADGSEVTWTPPELTSSPGRIAADSDNRVYVCDTASGSVQVFACDGAFVTAWGVSGGAPGQFDFSQGGGVAVDSSGNICVADAASDRGQRFGPPENSFILAGTFDDVNTQMTITQINGDVPANFAGFDPGTPDTLDAEVVYTYSDGSVMTFTETYTEQGDDTKRFMTTWDVLDGQEEWAVASPRRAARTDPYRGSVFTIRLNGLDEGTLDDYQVVLNDVPFELEQKDEGIFIRGPSKEMLYHYKRQDGTRVLLYYDRGSRRLKTLETFSSGERYEAWLQKRLGSDRWVGMFRKKAAPVPLKLKVEYRPAHIAEQDFVLNQRVVPMGLDYVGIEEMSLKDFRWNSSLRVYLEQDGEGRAAVVGKPPQGNEVTILPHTETSGDVTQYLKDPEFDGYVYRIRGHGVGKLLLKLQFYIYQRQQLRKVENARVQVLVEVVTDPLVYDETVKEKLLLIYASSYPDKPEWPGEPIPWVDGQYFREQGGYIVRDVNTQALDFIPSSHNAANRDSAFIDLDDLYEDPETGKLYADIDLTKELMAAAHTHPPFTDGPFSGEDVKETKKLGLPGYTLQADDGSEGVQARAGVFKLSPFPGDSGDYMSHTIKVYGPEYWHHEEE
ncbi:MAG: hypothetical protein HQ592_07055 [Planctomycetes bacterium]|nr:hypothetical protein [Planctomycetota bacterium]